MSSSKPGLCRVGLKAAWHPGPLQGRLSLTILPCCPPCRKCVEVKCDPRGVTDLYGSYYSFTADVCKPGSVTVMIPDNCPKASNQRWCSGDMPHLDLSIEAFSSVSILVSAAPSSRPPSAVCASVHPINLVAAVASRALGTLAPTTISSAPHDAP